MLQAWAMVELLRLMGWAWEGLVSNDDFGRFGIQMLMDALKGTEVCIAYYEGIPYCKVSIFLLYLFLPPTIAIMSLSYYMQFSFES